MFWILGAYWKIGDFPTDRNVGSEFRKTTWVDMKNLKGRVILIIGDDVGVNDLAEGHLAKP